MTGISANADVRLPKLVSDGMVLQRNQPIPVWGWANAGEKITAQFLGKSYTTRADKQGNWKITLPAQPAGTGYSLKINNIEIKDVLIGDLWLCSGQSNMELPLRRVTDLYSDEIRQINNPYIRHFKTPLSYNFQHPETDLAGGEWKAATPENIMDFSAVAYFFAQDLYEKYQIPIGLINSSVGGSPAEAWISEETLKNYPAYFQEAEKCKNSLFVENTKKQDAENIARWFMELNEKAVNDTPDWNAITLPGYWTDKNVDLQAGLIWFRKTIEIPAEMAGKETVLRLGCIVDSDSVFVNGEFVGATTYQYPPRIYPVRAGLLKAGKNEIVVRVVSNSLRGGFVEEKPYRIGDIDLSGSWQYKTGAKTAPMLPTTTFHYKPLGLYNAMIAPLLNIPIKGIIWYQGESNTNRAEEYAQLFPDLIRDWRKQFQNPDLPFLYVQLANFMKPQKLPQESEWAELREAQRKTLALPNTGMAVSIDLGEWNDIHPLNKKEVGRRLSFEAQRIAYQENINFGSPVYESMRIENNAIILTFQSVGSGLYSNNLLQGFSIAGENGKYVWANAVVIANDKVKVWSDFVKNPVSVHYAWADNPCDANLKNREGLPATPFIAVIAGLTRNPLTIEN